MDEPKVLLFDLGGVIVRWVGLDELSRITGFSRDEVSIKFATSPILQAYEIGQCDDDVFADTLIAEFNLKTSRSEAKALWNSWVQESYTGTKDVLAKLRGRYTLACLSNTNSLHWEHLQTYIKTDELFDYNYASHLINAAKPNPESYQIPITDMGMKPSDIWFFDDTMVNVQAAKKAGMKAYHVDRDVGVIPTLKGLGLLN